MQAIEYEAKRQVDVYDNNGEVFQETRLFDQSKGETRPMRSKEFAHDYRYFPDPDLLPLELDQSYIDKIKETLPELPDEKKSRFINEYKLDEYDASVLVSDSAIADYFEIVANGRDSKISANWVMTNLFSVLNKKSLSIQDSPVSAENLGILIDLIGNKIISGRIAKDVFEIMVEEKTSPADIVEEKGLKQITNTDSIEAAVDEVISENPDKVGEYKGGKTKLIGWFVGQVMKKTKGKANPGIVNEILSKKL
jgi:aspartyl-tRNA(Asn)/glutamyl-tRNA(Gln) amidotransferase subunit B